MGIFIRKRFQLGKLRLNLSNHGLGASVGVFHGFNLGVNAHRKMYVSGTILPNVYYRQNLPVGREVRQPRHAAGFWLGWLAPFAALAVLIHYLALRH